MICSGARTRARRASGSPVGGTRLELPLRAGPGRRIQAGGAAVQAKGGMRGRIVAMSLVAKARMAKARLVMMHFHDKAVPVPPPVR